MGNSKTAYKTGKRSTTATTSGPVKGTKKRNITKPGPIRATRVDESAERAQRIKWFLKWLLFLPLSMYVVTWILLLMYDLFS